jgi:hypothetical protein
MTPNDSELIEAMARAMWEHRMPQERLWTDLARLDSLTRDDYLDAAQAALSALREKSVVVPMDIYKKLVDADVLAQLRAGNFVILPPAGAQDGGKQ